MKIVKNEIDSIVLNKTSIDIFDYEYLEDFKIFESNYLKEFSPKYVVCKIPSEQIENIHILENNGFNFIEFQLKARLVLEDSYSTFAYFPYKFSQVGDKAELEKVLDILRNSRIDNRFLVDPVIKNELSQKRYEILVKKSFENEAEFLYKLYNSQTNEIIGFKTFKIINKNEAQLFLGAVLKKYESSSYSDINNIYLFNELQNLGLNSIFTNISGRSYKEINQGIKGFKYEVQQTYLVLRKIY